MGTVTVRQAPRRIGKRSAQPMGGALTPYEAANDTGLLPAVTDVGPFQAARYQPTMTRLARHLNRNDTWTSRAVEQQCDLVVGSSIVPVSPYPELDEIFMRACRQFDSRGQNGFAGFIREDVYKRWAIDGEVFLRFKEHEQEDIDQHDMVVAMAVQSLSTEFVPWHRDGAATNGNPIRAGIEFSKTNTDRRRGYYVYASHPRDAGFGLGSSLEMFRVPAQDMLHFFTPAVPGSPRGEVPLASALIRALKVASYDDAELRRKITSTLSASFLETPLEAGADQARFPTEDEIDDLLSQVALEPGAILRLPAGMKVSHTTPADTPASFQPYLKYQLMALAATAGIPPHELTGDVEGLSDRSIKFLGLGTQRRVNIRREALIHQVLNPIRQRFIDYCVAAGVWSPAPGRPLWDAYECDWQMDPIQVATLNQDLKAMIEAVNAGLTTRGQVSRQYLGLQGQAVDRIAAKEAARAKTLGLRFASNENFDDTTPVASRIAAEALSEETRERDIVEAASGDSVNIPT